MISEMSEMNQFNVYALPEFVYHNNKSIDKQKIGDGY